MRRPKITIACASLLCACHATAQTGSFTPAEQKRADDADHRDPSIPAQDLPAMGSVGFLVPDVEAVKRALVVGLGGTAEPSGSAGSAVVVTEKLYEKRVRPRWGGR